jgi:hypothetical protein
VTGSTASLGPERRQVAPQVCKRCEHPSANGVAQLCLGLDLPHERGEHRNYIRCLAPAGVLIAHLRLMLQRPRIVVRSLSDARQSLTGAHAGRAGLAHGAQVARAAQVGSPNWAPRRSGYPTPISCQFLREVIPEHPSTMAGERSLQHARESRMPSFGGFCLLPRSPDSGER